MNLSAGVLPRGHLQDTYNETENMKITLHKNIARYFGYEFVKLGRIPYRDIHAHLLELFKRLDINCVLDVGANMGQYASGLRGGGTRDISFRLNPSGNVLIRSYTSGMIAGRFSIMPWAIQHKHWIFT